MKFKPVDKTKPNYVLRLVFTLHKRQERWVTGISVPKSLWLDKAQQLSFDQKQLNKAGWTVPEVNDTNQRLIELRLKLVTLINEQNAADVFNVKHVREKWEAFRDGKAEKAGKTYKYKSETLTESIAACVAHKKRYPQANTMGGKPITKATENNFNQARSSVAQFDEHHKTTTTLQNCDLDWYAFYVDFLSNVLCLTGESPAKHVRNVKTCLEWASDQGMKVNQDFRKKAYRAPLPFKEQKAVLTWAEIDKLRNLKVTGNREVARDRFLIACYTGMRAGDLQNLDSVKVRKQQGMDVLQYRQGKTGATVAQVLRKPVRAIRQRWDGWPPPISDQRLNDHIKELCKEAGLNDKMRGYLSVQVEVLGKTVTRQKAGTVPRWKLVSIHSGRRSFCTNCYDDIGSEGKERLTVRDIMSWSGHVKEKTFYGYINREPVSDALRMAQFYS